MKLLIRHLDQKPSASFTAHLEKRLQIFTDIRQIDEARATLEHPSEASPAFRVTLHLATPGPDFSAEAVDHTLRAALTKTVFELLEKIQERETNRGPSDTDQPSRTRITSARCETSLALLTLAP